MHQKIKQTERPDLDKGRATLHALLELLQWPDSLYEAAGDQARGVLNQAIFTRLYLNADDEGPQLTEDEPTETFAPLVNILGPSGPFDGRQIIALRVSRPVPFSRIFGWSLRGGPRRQPPAVLAARTIAIGTGHG